MRIALALALALILGSFGCAGGDDAATPEPPTTEVPECFVDADCMVASGSLCCRECCDCPYVTSVAARAEEAAPCGAVECTERDCDAVRCRACEPIAGARCVAGRCAAQ